jgi:site-specific recombinase
MKNILEEFVRHDTQQKSGDLLTVLVSMIRPKSADNAGVRYAEGKLGELIIVLSENPDLMHHLKWHIRNIILQGDIEHVLSDSGVAEGGSFFSEFGSRLKHLVLPELKRPNDLGDIIRQVFYKPSDHYWVSAIREGLWIELFELLGMRLHTSDRKEIHKMFDAATALSFRICGNILDKEFQDYPEFRRNDVSPFFRQNLELSIFRSKFEAEESMQGMGHRLFEELERCRLNIEMVKRDRSGKGAGLQQTFLLVKLERQITRLKIITAMLDDDLPVDIFRTVIFFKRIVFFESRKNRIGALITDNIGLLAFQISEHKSHTGEHYITNTRKEYMSFFRSACGGGVFAAAMGIIKLMIGDLKLALFWQHFWYSVNYAFGFVGIHVTGSTLATKQPSMTAAALASSLDINKSGIVSPSEIAITFGKVWRSQFVAFAGNLLITFPAAFILAVLYDLIIGTPIASGEKAQHLLEAQNPFETPVYIYASITGLMLFVSGLISGYYDNMVLFSKIPERVVNHPLLNKFLPQSFLLRFGNYLKYNMGSLAGNIALGFLLGFPSFFGNILGISLDIRHITIATAHYAIGIYGSRFDFDTYQVLGALFGIGVIGFMNFIVSFSLAFWIAIKSRNIRFSNYFRIPYYIFLHFRQHPMDFIYPPKNPRMPEELKID